MKTLDSAPGTFECCAVSTGGYGAVLVTLLAVTGMSAMEAVIHRPGVRPAADNLELRAWLLSPESKDDSVDGQRHMARKAAAGFRQGFDWSQLTPALSVAQRELLARNFCELTRVWLLDRADDWHRRPRNRRGQTLDREVSGLLNWRLPPAADGTPEPAENDAARLDQLRTEAETCLAGESPEPAGKRSSSWTPPAGTYWLAVGCGLASRRRKLSGRWVMLKVRGPASPRIAVRGLNPLRPVCR